MKKQIHPQYNTTTTVTCSCGATYTIGSTVENMHVELCAACHPFYTGKQTIVDTANRVKRYEEIEKNSLKRQHHIAQVKKQEPKKNGKKEIKPARPVTLRDMLNAVQQQNA